MTDRIKHGQERRGAAPLIASLIVSLIGVPDARLAAGGGAKPQGPANFCFDVRFRAELAGALGYKGFFRRKK